MKLVLIPVAAVLLALSTCARHEYVKAGVTDEIFAKDSRECAEIARQQAFRDYARDFGHPFLIRRDLHGRTAFFPDPWYPSAAELEHRYRRICMFSRGYELVPVTGN